MEESLSRRSKDLRILGTTTYDPMLPGTFFVSWIQGVRESVPPLQNKHRPKGSITIDNDLYGRYRGEMQITLTDLSADERVNVVGRVKSDDLPLLEQLKPGMVIELV
jgi:hypothetical protein